MNDLTTAAQKWGIETEYYDVFGNCHAADAQTLTRLIDAMTAARIEPRAIESPNETRRAYQGDGRRSWALAVQLYALRSHRNWGHGDFTDLAQLIALAAQRGAAAIGLNPLHALFIDRPDEPSPYAPNSRLFLNPLYIDIDSIAEFPGLPAAGLQAEIEALRATDMIAYRRVAAAKLHGLHLAHASFHSNGSAERRADFESYRGEQGEALLRFACFEVLRRQNAPRPWTAWPQPWRNPNCTQLEDFRQAHAGDCEFYEFVQWIADRQLGACLQAARRLGMPIGLYTDLAVGIDRQGADAWSQQDAVLADVAMGAPPDELNHTGTKLGLGAVQSARAAGT